MESGNADAVAVLVKDVAGDGAGGAPEYKRFGSGKMVLLALGTLLLAWIFSWLYIGASWDPLVRRGAEIKLRSNTAAPSLRTRFAANKPSLAWPQANTGNLPVAVLDCDLGVPAAVQQQLDPKLALLGAKLAQEPIGTSLLATGVWSPSSPANR